MTKAKSGCAAHHLILLFQRQDTAGVGERVDDHGGVLARLDDLVEIAYGAAAHGQRERAVVPDGAFRRQQIAAGEIGGGHILVRGDGDQRPLEPPRHVLDEAGLATAGRALEHHRQPIGIGRFEQRDLVADRPVIGLGIDAIRIEVHRAGPFRGRTPVQKQKNAAPLPRFGVPAHVSRDGPVVGAIFCEVHYGLFDKFQHYSVRRTRQFGG